MSVPNQNQTTPPNGSSYSNVKSHTINSLNFTTPFTSQISSNISEITDKHLWTIATCNMRGLSNKIKRDLWFQYSHDKNWDILISTETDGNSSQSAFWKSNLFQTWWTHGPNKLGQGIGISINNKLATRVFKVHSWEGRILVLDLSFPRKRFLRIISIYYPANPSTPKHTIDSIIKQHITEALQQDWHIIIAGDFNAVSNPVLDKFSLSKKVRKQTPSNQLLQYLNNLSFIDSFREMNPGKKEYTWQNTQNSSSRIDQIWFSSSHTWNLAEAFIGEDTNPTITTDHRPSICKIEAWQLEFSETPTTRTTNNRFDWFNASDKKWEEFSQSIKKFFKQVPLTIKHPQYRWNQLRDIILKSAYKYIHKLKKHRKPRNFTNGDHIPKKIILLQRLIQKSKQYIQTPNNTQEHRNNLISIYNKALSYFLDLPKISKDELDNKQQLLVRIHEIKNFLLKHKSALQIITNFKQRQQTQKLSHPSATPNHI